MSPFYKLDLSSRVLIGAGLAGILTSIYLLSTNYFDKSDSDETGEAVAKITQSLSDTRVKRAGNIHWYPAGDSLSCFQDDMVFTGEGSRATIEFPSGDTISLLPNSLISISNNFLSLESGTIEVDLQSQGMTLESFGKKVELKEKSRFKMIQTQEENRIVVYSGAKPEFGVPVSDSSLTILRPSLGEEIVKIPGGELYFSWDGTKEEDTTSLQINGKIYATEGKSFKLPFKNLPHGDHNWKITSADGKIAESNFYILEPPTPVITLADIPPLLNFSVHPTVELTVSSTQPLESLEWNIENGSQTIASGNVVNAKILVPKLEDGNYIITVKGDYDNQSIQSKPYELNVKNSKPFVPPKIKKQGSKLFVKIFQNVLNFIFPVAHAAPEKHIHQFKWDGKKGEIYEVEVSLNKDTILSTQLTSDTSFSYDVGRPGNYYFRVRQKMGEQWGPFSDYDHVEVKDKVSLITTPLMKDVVAQDKYVHFKWDEPYKDFTYTLEIYRKGKKKPISTLPVEGGNKKFILDRKGMQLEWKITATSPYGNKTSNEETFPIPEPPQVKKKNHLYFFRANVSQIKNNYKLELKAPDATDEIEASDLAGASFDLAAEMWPSKWNQKYGMQAGFRNDSLSSSEIKLSTRELSFEGGYTPSEKASAKHTFYLGMQHSNSTFSAEGTTGNYNTFFGSGRYLFHHRTSEKLSLDFNTTFFITGTNTLASPSFRLRPAINWHFNPIWSVSFLMAYESIKAANINEGSSSEKKLSLDSTVMSYSIGINWRSF